MIRALLALLLVAPVAAAQVVPPDARRLTDVACVLTGCATSGSGDIESVTLTTNAPVTGGAACTSGACSFTLGLTGMTIGTNLQAWDADLDGVAGLGNGYPYRASATWAVSSPTNGKLPLVSAAGLVDSTFTHNATTGVTGVAGTGPSLTITDDNITTTSTDALVLQNTTAATAGVTAQYSPRFRFLGSAWKSNATAAAQSTEWWIENVPTSRPATPSNALVFQPRLNGVLGTAMSMCAGDTFLGVTFGGAAGECHTGSSFKGWGASGANILGAWANGTLSVNVGSNHLGMAAGTILFWNSTTLSSGGTSTGDTNLIRQAAGVVGVRGASSIRGAILGARVVAAQASTPLTLVDPTDIDKVFTNEGAAASIVFNLPTAVAGVTYTFVVQDTDGLSVVAAAGDTIRIAASVSAAAGNIASTTIGNTVILVAINATEWVAIAVNGTWTVT